LALTLVSFGSPRLLDDSGVVIAFPEKGLLAAGYIATRPGRSVTRAELAAFLWDEDSSNPLVNLRQLLSRVKARQQEVGITLLELRKNDVLAPAGGIDCDFLRLKSLPANRPLEIVEMSLAYVTGAFFAGIGTASERAELWLAEQQEHVLSRFAQALETLAGEPGQPSRGHMQRAAAYRLLEFDPYSEIAYRILINAFTAEGNFTQARALFDRYSALLQKDLKAQPDGDMLAIRDRAARQAVERLPAAPATERPPTSAISPRTGLPRLMLIPPPSGNAQGAGLLATSLLEDVTIGLCRARSIQLVAPHTARRVALMDEAGRQEAYRNCDVSYVLETRFTPGAEADALFASLVNVPDDATVWAERLPIDPASLGASYNTMVRRISAAALSQIERHEFSRIGRTTAPTAYQNFLIGKHYVRNMELPDIRRARKAFRETLREMPDFSPALSGLSRTAHLEWLVTARGDTEMLKLSEKYAQAAINADDDDPGGFHQLGVSRLYRGAFDESIELLEIAERIAPSHADLIADHADTLVHASRLEEALAKINLAFELNPFAPDYYWWSAAGANFSLHRYEAAIDNLTHVADQTNVLRFNAACWAMMGNMRKARAYMRRTLENFPDFEADRWLSLIPIRDPAQKEHYREGLRLAGFK
jgi:DNA-binding SARP family transcriptional activator/TolB-like protein